MDYTSRTKVNIEFCLIRRNSSSWTNNSYKEIVLIDGQVAQIKDMQSWKGYLTLGVSSFFHEPYFHIIGEYTEANEETANKIFEMAKQQNISCLINLYP